MNSNHFTRRDALKGAGALAMAVSALEIAGPLAWTPQRASAATCLPDIQFDIDAFLAAPPQTSATGVVFQLPPVHTVFATAKLQRTPTRRDQRTLARALDRLEASYPFGARHIITIVSYGLPYFSRLTGGLTGGLVAEHLPRLLSDTSRYVLEEAVAGPTDVSPANPGIIKVPYNVPVALESNDMLFTIRGDNAQFISDVLAWLAGSNVLRGCPVESPSFDGLLSFTSSRYQFVQMGLPKAVAVQNNLAFANYMQHDSPMWLGFADQQTSGNGPPAICTFAGNDSARLTTATAGDYFDNGSIQHLSHVILGMLQWFDMSTATTPPKPDGFFIQRVQYMFQAPNMVPGNTDPLTDGGGPSFLNNTNNGPGYAAQEAAGIVTNIDPATGLPERRMGHLSCLQRSSRAADGTPIHIRMDGPGFDNMDIPDGSNQAKLQFTIFVPSADFFRTMRINQVSSDLQQEFGVQDIKIGLERLLTATRRQNFLCPPRRHRAFPLVEFT